MFKTYFKRGVGGFAAAALVLSGASLALALPANAAAGETLVTQTDIGVDESVYMGWHEGYTNVNPAFSVALDGLHLGDGAPSQIIDGLVDAGTPGLPIATDELKALILGSDVSIVTGDVVLQVPITTGTAAWATLRSHTWRTSTSGAVALTDDWTVSRNIGTLVKDAPVALGTLIDTLGAQGNLRYSAFGVLAVTPAVVSDISFGTQSFTFVPATTTILSDVSSTVVRDEAVFTATVALDATSDLVPDGTVVFAGENVTSDPIALVDGVATFSTTNLHVGESTVTATYSGSVAFVTSTTSSVFTIIDGAEFNDPTTQFTEDIQWLRQAGITTPADTFRPNDSLSRQAMAAFLYRYAGSPEFTAPTETPFTDVTVNDDFYLEMAWCLEQGITTVDTFRPLDAVTRQAMAAYVYRISNSPTFTEPVESLFLDVATDGSFYKEISWLADVQVSEGYTVTGGVNYMPNRVVTRQAIAAFLHRAALLP